MQLLCFHIMFVNLTRLSMAWSRPHVLVTIALWVFFFNKGLYALGLILLYLFTARVLLSFICLFMLIKFSMGLICLIWILWRTLASFIIIIQFVSSEEQVADIVTNALCSPQFLHLRSKLQLHSLTWAWEGVLGSADL